MASVLDQLPNSNFSLVGNGFNAQPDLTSTSAGWGYSTLAGGLDPHLSKLHYYSPSDPGYSVDGSPNVRIVDFNRAALGGVTRVKPPSTLDELDRNAPNNTGIGRSYPGVYGTGKGPVVSQIYKSKPGRRYKDLGPAGGRY
jgi:hypothetical protein